MKQLFFLSFLIFLFLGSCFKKDANQFESDLTTTSWKITQFLYDNSDNTSDYSNYVFNFNSDSKLTTLDDVITYDGSWSTSSSDPVIFNLSMNYWSTELNQYWDVVSHSSTKIELKHESLGDTDILVFEIN
jgi:hypothetical protein